MLQISPQTTLPLVYLIQDHTDPNTYYVRAVVKNSHTGEVLKTIDLTDNGNRRFTGNYNIPAMEDKYLDITISVYSDSGHTTKAQDKYEVNTQYLVKTQWGLQFGGAGGATRMEVDYKKIQKMIDEAISSIEKVEKFDDTSILTRLNGLKKDIAKIKMPDMPQMVSEKVDLSPVLQRFVELKAILNKKLEVVEQKPVDLSVVTSLLEEIKREVVSQKEEEVVEDKKEEPKVEEKPIPSKVRVVGGYKLIPSMVSIDKKRVTNLLRK